MKIEQESIGMVGVGVEETRGSVVLRNVMNS